MKRKVVTTAIVYLLAALVVWSPPVGGQAADAIITDAKGAKTSVRNIRAHLHDSCKGFLYYLGIPTDTDSYADACNAVN